MQTVSDALRAERPLLLDRYRLGRKLGSGGFGTVWAAHDEKLDRPVAVKRIALGGGHGPEIGARAEREAKAAARLSHTSIVALYETAADDDAVYLVSELVRGRTLDRLTADGVLSDRDVLRLGAELCDALAHAHGRGVVHRDVKPANVIVPDDDAGRLGPAKLTDFGIAQLRGDDDALTRTGDVVGTLAYMAPEQAEGRTITPAVDLYALGLVLFEALAGVNPVRGRTPAATVRRVGVRLPPLGRLRRDLPVELCAAIDRAVAIHPEQRGCLKELKKALKGARTEVDDAPGTVEAGALEPLTRLGRRTRSEVSVSERVRMPVRPLTLRALAGLGGAGLAAGALATLGPVPPATPGAAASLADGSALAGAASLAHGSALASDALGAVSGAAARGASAALTAGVARSPTGTAAAGIQSAATGHHLLGAGAPLAPGLGALIAFAVVAAFPRLGWGALAVATLTWLIAAGEPGTALLVALAVAPVPLLLAGARPGWWSAPGAGVAVAALGAGLGVLALTGQARRWTDRAALGALAAWWALLAEPVAGRVLLAAGEHDTRGPGASVPRAAWEGSVAHAAEQVVGPLLGSGALLLAAVWACGAAVLPLLVRGRWVAVDVVAAVAWAAALAAASQATLGALRWAGAAPHLRGLVLGAALAAAGAVLARAAAGPVR